jgi:hypothetical protein
MNTCIRMLTLAAGLCALSTGFAQPPEAAPAGTTGLCKDGTYYSGATKKGACRGHKGVQDWYGPAAAASTAAAAAPATAPAATPVAPAAAPAAAAKAPAKTTFAPPANPAAGGGPGLVWVNSSSKVYHCQGDRWYGKTKQGEYMTEANAKAQNFRPDHGKPCQ